MPWPEGPVFHLRKSVLPSISAWPGQAAAPPQARQVLPGQRPASAVGEARSARRPSRAVALAHGLVEHGERRVDQRHRVPGRQHEAVAEAGARAGARPSASRPTAASTAAGAPSSASRRGARSAGSSSIRSIISSTRSLSDLPVRGRRPRPRRSSRSSGFTALASRGSVHRVFFFMKSAMRREPVVDRLERGRVREAHVLPSPGDRACRSGCRRGRRRRPRAAAACAAPRCRRPRPCGRPR